MTTSTFYQVLELVLCVLELHQNIEKGTSDPEVCRVCFGVVTKYLEGKSRKNKNYITELAKHDFLFSDSVSNQRKLLQRSAIQKLNYFGQIWQTPLGEETSVEKLLVALVEDNPYVKRLWVIFNNFTDCMVL